MKNLLEKPEPLHPLYKGGGRAPGAHPPRIRKAFGLLLVLALLLAACGPGEAGPAPTGEGGPEIELQDCQLSAPGLSQRLSARCGTLQVYEDPASASGRQISLKIAVYPAVSRNPEPDPLFFLTGGPGQAATESFLQLYPAFDRIHQRRDIVLVDQRGTGASNPLRCPNLDDEDLLEEAEIEPLIDACLAGLEADPRFYTTSAAIEDLERVRAALGYGQINLYGLSYGTRTALSYLGRYPEQVRAVILDGVLPQSEILGLDMAPDAQRALDLLFERCREERGCNEAFPNLEADFQALLAELEVAPATVEVNDPVSGEPVEVELSAQEVATAVRLLTYAPETAALVPVLIHTTRETGDYARLASQYLILSRQLSESLSEGMYYSVVCSEDVPFYNPEQAARAAQGTYLSSLEWEQTFEICSRWPQGQIPQDFKEPVRSEAPVLLLSGELDPVTPPENAEQAAQTLPNSLHLVAPGQGHNVIYRGCLPRLAADFIEQGAVEGLDTACVQEIRPMPFFVNFNGPQP